MSGLESTKNKISYHKEFLYDIDMLEWKEGETGNNSFALKQKYKTEVTSLIRFYFISLLSNLTFSVNIKFLMMRRQGEGRRYPWRKL